MAKRAATTQMTHDNWDREDEEPEEPGEFAAASVDELAQRKIRVAKRRFVGQDSNKGSSGSIFGAFTGFGTKPTTMSNPISAPNSLNLPPGPTFGAGLPSLISANKPASLFTGTSASTPVTNKLPDFVVQPSKPSMDQVSTADVLKSTKTADNPTEYYADLKALNEGVIAWMQDNFQKNPLVDFSPVFNDYKNHFKELEEKYHVRVQTAGKEATDNGVKETVIPRSTNINDVSPTSSNGSSIISVVSKTPSIPAVEPQPTPQTFKFGLNSGASLAPAVPTVIPAPQVATSDPKPFSFILSSSATAAHNDPKPFSFGLPPATTAPTSTATVSMPSFSFGSGASSLKPFTFGVKPAATEKPVETENQEAANGGEEEAEYEPPKPERVELVEDDAFYNIRCKLFYKKEGKFVEKGVGTLFLKPLDGGKKTQLLIRADTATGNILLNLGLNDSIPCSLNGKNNVTLVCVPHPPLDPKSPANEPAVLLIRVKTTEDANKLLEEINKAKLNV